MKAFREYLGKQVLFFDGGTGSVLQSQGLKPGELPENWNIEHPEKIVQLGYGYYLAGSNIINSNSFGAFSTKFTGTDGKYSVEQVIDAALQNSGIFSCSSMAFIALAIPSSVRIFTVL